MTAFLDILIVLATAARLVAKAELLPLPILTEHIGTFGWAIVGLLVFKYILYLIRTLRAVYESVKYDGKKPAFGYIISYVACDLLRLGAALGLMAAIVFNLVESREFLGLFLDRMAYGVLILAALVINYFCNGSETIRFNVIITAVFFVFVAVFSGRLALDGFQLLIR